MPAGSLDVTMDNTGNGNRRRARRTALILGAIAVAFYVLAFISVTVFHALY